MKRIVTVSKGFAEQDNFKNSGCGECQTFCQSACKTSCGVANQKCENLEISEKNKQVKNKNPSN